MFDINSHFTGGYGNSDFFDRQMGHLTPWSHVPHMVRICVKKTIQAIRNEIKIAHFNMIIN